MQNHEVPAMVAESKNGVNDAPLEVTMRNIQTCEYAWMGGHTNDDVTRALTALSFVRTVRRVSVSPTRVKLTFDADEVGAAHFQRALSRSGPYRLLHQVQAELEPLDRPPSTRKSRRRRRRAA